MLSNSHISQLPVILALHVMQTWLRVLLGYHTTAQVVAGYSLGTGTALVWYTLGSYFEPIMMEGPVRVGVYCFFGLAASSFSMLAVQKWIKDEN